MVRIPGIHKWCYKVTFLSISLSALSRHISGPLGLSCQFCGLCCVLLWTQAAEDRESERSHRGWPPPLVIITLSPNGWKEFPPSECSLLLTSLRVTAISAMELHGGEGMRKMAKEGKKKKTKLGDFYILKDVREVLAFVPWAIIRRLLEISLSSQCSFLDF